MKSIMQLALLAIILLGCDRGPKLGMVSGKITWEGNPLEGATITFAPENGLASRDRTGPDGSYKLKFADGRYGTMLGENNVTIETYRVGAEGPDGNPVIHPEILPAKYHAESEMTRTVEPGEQVFDFELNKDD